MKFRRNQKVNWNGFNSRIIESQEEESKLQITSTWRPWVKNEEIQKGWK